jgi:hypothetical protein
MRGETHEAVKRRKWTQVEGKRCRDSHLLVAVEVVEHRRTLALAAVRGPAENVQRVDGVAAAARLVGRVLEEVRKAVLLRLHWHHLIVRLVVCVHRLCLS